MSIRDPQFTLRLEPALRFFSRQPQLSVAYVSHRFDIEKGDLVAWLAEFNEGSKLLTATRIDKVKAELGSISTKVEDHKGVAPGVSITKEEVKHALEVAGVVPVKLAAPKADIGHWLEDQKAKIVGRVNSFQVEVTPAMASTWLAFNDGNRKPSRSKIRRFSAAIVAGRWILNGETVKFSQTGRLLDGQSRLMAIVAAGKPALLEVRAGLPDLAQKTMDCGELRKTSHTLEMMGVSYPNETSRALKMCWLIERDLLSGNQFGMSSVMENNEVQAIIDRHAALKDSIQWMASVQGRLKLILPKSEAAFFHYIFGVIDPSLRDVFCEALVDGTSLTKSSPVLHLRNWLLNVRVEGATRSSSRERYGHIIKAWNAARAGEKLTVLRFSAGETFPLIDGWKPTAAAA